MRLKLHPTELQALSAERGAIGAFTSAFMSEKASRSKPAGTVTVWTCMSKAWPKLRRDMDAIVSQPLHPSKSPVCALFASFAPSLLDGGTHGDMRSHSETYSLISSLQ